MKIFTTSQVRELDHYTIIHEPVTSLDLMERASLIFTETFVKNISILCRIIVFAGPGNNGGDALAVARILLLRGYNVRVYLLVPKKKIAKAAFSSYLSTDCEMNRLRLLPLIGDNYIELSESLSSVEINREDIVIDGLFGSGLNKPLTGIPADLVQRINASQAKIYSIDIPSGLFGESNEDNMSENIIRATQTLTFQFPKLSFLLPGNEEFCGEWKILDIGLHEEAIRKNFTDYYFMEKKEIAALLHRRNKFAYKNNFGHALVVAGSKGKMGAAVLAVRATLSSGCGLVTGCIPARGEGIMQTAFPEAMLMLDSEEDIVSNIDYSDSFSAIGIGPGIGTDERTQIALEILFLSTKVPMVIDADALNIMVQNKKLIRLLPAKSILTPHVGEFDRLTIKHNSSYLRLQTARAFAEETNCIVVLKGAYSAVCLPDKKVYFNPTGNPGMATAGSGDVLTGILTGLLAQSYSAEDAAKIGVYIHGLAGDIASGKASEESMIASDIMDNLGAAFSALRS